MTSAPLGRTSPRVVNHSTSHRRECRGPPIIASARSEALRPPLIEREKASSRKFSSSGEHESLPTTRQAWIPPEHTSSCTVGKPCQKV